MNKRLQAMREGGKLLSDIKHKLVSMSAPGVSLEDIDIQADQLLRDTGGKPSFSMVPGYHWATCINLNHGIVHGIPTGTLKDADLVTIDVGLYYKGFHTDTSTSFVVGRTTKQKEQFLKTGRVTLTQAINIAKPGNKVWDISHLIQTKVESAGYSVVRNLTGHGVGKKLHQEPSIPCFVDQPRDHSPSLTQGQTLAVEVMFTLGGWQTITKNDHWTIETRDKSLAAVFEETIIVSDPPEPLTVTT